jgi:3-oxoacyl-[acyl-carrier-protein] synthase-3
VIGDCADAESLDLSTAVLLVPDHSPAFGDRLAAALGIDRRSVVGVAEDCGAPHTAAPLFAYDNAIKSGNWSGDQQLLFVSAHGPTASCISYRDQRSTTKEQ